MRRFGIFALIATLILPATVARAESLKVGTTTSGQPTSGINPQTKQLEGFAVELIRAIAKDAEFEIEFQTMPFGELQSALVSLRPVTALRPSARKQRILPTLTDRSEIAVVPVSDTKSYKTLSDFKGMKVATPRGSSVADPLKEAGADFVLVSAPPDGLRELEAGNVAAVVDNGLQLTYRLKIEPHPKLKIIDTYPPTVTVRLAFAVHKGNDALREKLNISLHKLQINGTVRDIAGRWGVEL